MSPNVLIIIPAYNEQENILRTYRSIKNFDTSWDVIVINDGSTDNTQHVLETNHIPSIQLLRNLGIGGAVQTGYKYAHLHDYDIAIQFDGDGQHNVEFIPKLIQPILDSKADFVIGSRFVDNNSSGFQSSKLRRIGIRIISVLILLVGHQKITDPTSGFRSAGKRVITLFSHSYPAEFPEPESIVMLLKNNLRIFETHTLMNERIGGVSSIRAWKSAYYMINVCLSIFMVSIKRKLK